MANREEVAEVINGLYDALGVIGNSDSERYMAYSAWAIEDAIELLEVHIQPSPEKLPNADWIANMTAEERLNLIAAFCVDWDGYRTADGLGTLLNEIWAYAIYPVRTSRPTDEQREVTAWDE